jgi:hypothetical protein
MSAVNFLPTFLIGPIMQVSSYLASIGISVDIFGVKGYEFGSCVLTSIGSLGIESGFPPIPRIQLFIKLLHLRLWLFLSVRRKQNIIMMRVMR